MQKARSRYLILLAGCLTGCFTGSIYMWSIFNEPLMQAYSWPLPLVSFAYSLFIAVDCLGCVAAGQLLKRIEVSRLLLIAGVLFGAGWFLTGFARTVPQLYLSYCIVAGFGDGIIYNVALSTACKWFPDKRGMANGICLGCVGMSSLVFAPLGNFLISTFGVSGAFRVFGLFALVIFVVFARMVVSPEPGWAPEGYVGDAEDAEGRVEPSVREYTLGEILHMPLAWLLLVCFAAMCSAGMLVTAHASDIGQLLVGMDAGQGALMVGLLAVGSGCGRLFFGTLSDRTGCVAVLVVCMLLTVCDMLLIGQVSTFPLFIVALCLVGACFGGTMAVMATLVAELFGSANFSQNYSFFYIGYTLACFIGPMVAAFSMSATGSYTPAFLAGALLAAAAIVMLGVIKRRSEQLQAG